MCGPWATVPTGPYGRVVAGPPSTGTARAQLRRRVAWSWVLTARTWPSGVQPRTRVCPLPQYVSRVDGPPSTGAMCTSGAPSRVEVQATVVPSGEMRGRVTGTLSALTRQARPPSRGASHTSSSAVKVTDSPCRWGYRRYAAGVAGCVTGSLYASAAPQVRGFPHFPAPPPPPPTVSVTVTVTVTVGRAPGRADPDGATGDGVADLQSPSPLTRNNCFLPTTAVRSPGHRPRRPPARPGPRP